MGVVAPALPAATAPPEAAGAAPAPPADPVPPTGAASVMARTPPAAPAAPAAPLGTGSPAPAPPPPPPPPPLFNLSDRRRARCMTSHDRRVLLACCCRDAVTPALHSPLSHLPSSLSACRCSRQCSAPVTREWSTHPVANARECRLRMPPFSACAGSRRGRSERGGR